MRWNTEESPNENEDVVIRLWYGDNKYRYTIVNYHDGLFHGDDYFVPMTIEETDGWSSLDEE